ncbi:MAG TPA: S53 family peptidase [Verrucomicrobiae bacterium]|jgi:kumamolisin|nr:S53 family peptidase [Verrucomicrobiae bacterium]
MKLPSGYKALKGSEHSLPKGDKALKPTSENEMATVTLILRRRLDGPKLKTLEDFSANPGANGPSIARADFTAAHGADPDEMNKVVEFAQSHGLAVLERHAARRAVVVHGKVGALNKAFAVRLTDYSFAGGKYHGHTGPAHLPASVAKCVEAICGLNERPVPAKHWVTRRPQHPTDPPNTTALTPQQVALLYNFPPGDGAGQTIGIYEMTTGDGAPGYAPEDLVRTMQAFGGGLQTPAPIDVSIDGVANSGVSDGETGLDITVASAIAPAAKLAVYFTGGTPQNILHAIQRMVHPGASDPQPTILSISYGWGPDDASAQSFSDQEYTQLDQLFQDAANLNITVLVSSGDSGAFVASKTQAQTSYPSTEPWVISCGGTAIGDIQGTNFDEYAWNDGAQGGASGGGVSARFPVPTYQSAAGVPKRNGTKQPGRGVPDIAGNASPYSGYPQFVNGQSETIGGTSAVAPLYAGLLARINSNLGASVGFINPTLYSLAASAFRGIVSPPGPANNSFQGVTGYPVTSGWNACTGLGSAKGIALQNGLQGARGAVKQSAIRAPAQSAATHRRRGAATL